MESEQISFDTIVKTEAEQLRDAVQGSISDKEQYGKFIEVDCTNTGAALTLLRPPRISPCNK